MKKTIALLLVLVLSLSLCACKKRNTPSETPDASLYSETPNEIIVEHIQNTEESTSVSNNILANDVLLEVYRTGQDHLGNETTDGFYRYHYGAQGEITAFEFSFEASLDNWEAIYDPDGFWSYFENEFDEFGRVVSVVVYPNSTKNRIEAKISISYDDNGNLTSEHVLTNDGEYTNLYTYDEMDRLIQKTYTRSSSQYYITNYEYDESGSMIRKISLWYNDKDSIERRPVGKRETVYTIDETGMAISAFETYNYYVFDWEKTTSFVFVYDEKGRLIQEQATCTDFIDPDGKVGEPSEYPSYAVNYVYGDYSVTSES